MDVWSFFSDPQKTIHRGAVDPDATFVHLAPGEGGDVMRSQAGTKGTSRFDVWMFGHSLKI
jgi:hypothetical protein